MDKPFDFKDLGKRLEAQGLPAVEGLAEIATKEVVGWLEDSCALEVAQGQPVYAIGVPVLEALKPVVLAAEKSLLPKS